MNAIYAYNIVNLLILIIGVTVTVLSLDLMVRYSRKWYLFLPVVFWALHLTIFYSLVICSVLMGQSLDVLFAIPGLFSWWSILQRLNGVITMLFMIILLSVEIKYDFFKYDEKEDKSLLEKGVDV
jgi:hypothetical protein